MSLSGRVSEYLPMTSFGWSFSLQRNHSCVINERSLLFCSHDKPDVFYPSGK
jgi:hypothetical protein